MNESNIQANCISRDKTKDLVTLDQHFENALRHARTEFESTGMIKPQFECVTEGETFHVCANWSNLDEKCAACRALRDSFRRRGVNRYVFTSEAWVGRTPEVPGRVRLARHLPARPPSARSRLLGSTSATATSLTRLSTCDNLATRGQCDDPGRGECVQVIAIERNGSRKCARAEIMRKAKTVTLGPWEERDDVQGWWFELLGESYSDRASGEGQPLPTELSADESEDFRDQYLTKPGELRDSFEIQSNLRDLICDLQKHPNDDSIIIVGALENVLCRILKEMGSLTGVGAFARFLRDHPDKFPMFPTVPPQVPSAHHVSLYTAYTAALRRFSSEQREAGHSLSAIFHAFMNTYMYVGSQEIGALSLADRIQNWSPEHQAKLREVGLRSSSELDPEEGKVFLALSADRYPIGAMGRRNDVGDLFVSNLITFPYPNFATAVTTLKRSGLAELILGSAATELLRKFEQVDVVSVGSGIQ